MGAFSGKPRKSGATVYLVRGTDRGKKAWHYVEVSRLKEPIFLKAIQAGSLDVANFGNVICSGWGQDPPDSIVSEIRSQYD